MTREQKRIYRYSNCFKEKVVRESILSVCRRYDIRGTSTVQYRLRKYGRTELLNTVIRVKMRIEEDKIKQFKHRGFC